MNDPTLLVPWRASRCGNCGRVFEAATMGCFVCERPTRLFSPVQEFVMDPRRMGFSGRA